MPQIKRKKTKKASGKNSNNSKENKSKSKSKSKSNSKNSPKVQLPKIKLRKYQCKYCLMHYDKKRSLNIHKYFLHGTPKEREKYKPSNSNNYYNTSP